MNNNKYDSLKFLAVVFFVGVIGFFGIQYETNRTLEQSAQVVSTPGTVTTTTPADTSVVGGLSSANPLYGTPPSFEPPQPVSVPSISVILKVNNSTIPVAVNYGAVVTATWTASGGADITCTPWGDHVLKVASAGTNGVWDQMGVQPPTGTIQLYARHQLGYVTPLLVGISCSDPLGSSTSDMVTLPVNPITPITPTADCITTSTIPATEITSTSAVVNGCYQSDGTLTETFFSYTPSGGSNTVSPTIVQGYSNGPAAFYLRGLLPNTEYYFQMVSEDNSGTTRGKTISFKTLP